MLEPAHKTLVELLDLDGASTKFEDEDLRDDPETLALIRGDINPADW